jgi:excisionase family DNA binding protein
MERIGRRAAFFFRSKIRADEHEDAPSAGQPPRRQLTREDVLAVREVAELLHMPLSTIFDYARRGVIRGHKLGRRWLFRDRTGDLLLAKQEPDVPSADVREVLVRF